MGEIAEMMLDGTLCAGCGEVLDSAINGDGPAGFPQYCCKRCALDHGAEWDAGSPMPKRERGREPVAKPVRCPQCQRRFGTHDAYLQHYRDKHDRPAALQRESAEQ